jgi:hypothetical protein
MSSLGAHVSAGARENRPRRTPIALHVQVLLRRRSLDTRLLEGVDPGSSPELELRARQLTGSRHRRVLADSLDEVIRVAEGPKPSRLAASAPLVRGDVRAARGALLDLECSLRRDGAVHPAGVLLAQRLLTDGSGPLYVKAQNGALSRAARDASAALG